MQANVRVTEKHIRKVSVNQETMHQRDIAAAIEQAWKKIAPWWPLKNLIAANPLQGFENLSFEQALAQGMRHFQNPNVQQEMADVNRETIKWCQVFFDDGQAVINMPRHSDGIYHSWRQLLIFDERIHQNNRLNINWLQHLPIDPEQAILTCLDELGVSMHYSAEFLTILLTSLPGWSSFVKYQTEWTQGYLNHINTLTQTEYLAVRIIIARLLALNAGKVIRASHHFDQQKHEEILVNIQQEEIHYGNALMHELANPVTRNPSLPPPNAQLIFCIDVRSEPFRRAIEAQGNYETFGFAGFFGVPAIIEDQYTGDEYASCPVLLSPQHKVKRCSSRDDRKASHHSQTGIRISPKKLYRGLKYSMITPFALADAMGPWSGIWMTTRTLFPRAAKAIHAALNHTIHDDTFIDCRIPLQDQYQYAENLLRSIGLTSNFAPLVVLCGHGGETENNAYASALDCGACGGHDGAVNAKILAKILNHPLVRDYLRHQGIHIPSETHFIAALHHTTTDKVTLYHHTENELIQSLKKDLTRAQDLNCQIRHPELKKNRIQRKSTDWSETRPEWGLARNASFIIGSRAITRQIDLQGRAFLHSYNWDCDESGSILTTILTAPMVVAQWINCQYLFSTLDNIAYGSGSKITHNITGKIGIMQGNASDLMHGLPLQSIASTDQHIYHRPVRLHTFIHAPRQRISKIISEQKILQTLFGNGWVHVICKDPTDHGVYILQRDFSWHLQSRMDGE